MPEWADAKPVSVTEDTAVRPEDLPEYITEFRKILSKYNLGKIDAGALGVIGPVRLDYAKMIPYIKYFSDSVTRMLTAGEGFAEEGEHSE